MGVYIERCFGFTTFKTCSEDSCVVDVRILVYPLTLRILGSVNYTWPEKSRFIFYCSEYMDLIKRKSKKTVININKLKYSYKFYRN